MRLLLNLPILILLGAALLVAQQAPAPSSAPNNPIPEIDAEMGDCSADFYVTDTKMNPLYDAKISTQLKHGLIGIWKTDLEVATNVDGKARVVGLPEKPRGPLTFTADYQGRATVLIVEPREKCHGTFNAIVTDRPVKAKDDKDDEDAEE
jgi:hypothetical protein